MTTNCCVATCPRPQAVECKGLCMKCYSAAKKRIEAGETTWESLYEAGLAKRPSGVTAFDVAFDKLINRGK